MAFIGKPEPGVAEVISLDPAERAVELVEAQYREYDGPEDDGFEGMEEPETEGSESMEHITDPAEDTISEATPVPQPKRRRQGVSRLLVEAIKNNPGLTQSEYQRALGIKSPIATMAKRLVEKGIIQMKQDGRFVRYYPGTQQYTEVQTGRKPKTAAVSRPQPPVGAEERWLQPRWFKGWNIVTVAKDDGTTQRYVRLDGNWYEMLPVDGPSF